MKTLVKKQIKKIQRNTFQNKTYRSKIKTFIKKCLYLKNYYLIEKKSEIIHLIRKNFNLAVSILDKCQKIKIFNKRQVAKKKSKLHKQLNFIFLKKNDSKQ